MNRSTLPTNALAEEIDLLCELLVESISRSLRARSLTTAWELTGCAKVKDVDRSNDRKETLFSCNVSTENAEQFLENVRNKAPKAFRQASSSLAQHDACGMLALTKTVAEVLADERHFRHISRVFSALYLSTGANLHVCVFRTNDTLASDVLLIRFDPKRSTTVSIATSTTESTNASDAKSASSNKIGTTKGRMLSRFFGK